MVKGLDYALLNKVRSEIDKKPEAGDDGDGKSRWLFSNSYFVGVFLWIEAFNELLNLSVVNFIFGSFL